MILPKVLGELNICPVQVSLGRHGVPAEPCTVSVEGGEAAAAVSVF